MIQGLFLIHYIICECLFCLGCGSGLSGEVITESGHHWVGLDIAPSMLGMQVILLIHIYFAYFCFDNFFENQIVNL